MTLEMVLVPLITPIVACIIRVMQKNIVSGQFSRIPASQHPIKAENSRVSGILPARRKTSRRQLGIPTCSVFIRRFFLCYYWRNVRRSFNLSLIYFAQTQRPRAKSLKQTDCDLCVYATRISSVCSGFFIRLLV